jgi:hypothetical protein
MLLENLIIMKKINLPTIIAISALSWILVNITHEFVGHAGFGMLFGHKLNAVNTTTAYLDLDWDNSINQHGFVSLRFFCLGGVLMNFITGLIALLILKFKKPVNSQTNLFLWLFASFSFVVIVMNLVSVTLIGNGDLPGFIRTFNNQGTARIIILIIGLFIMITGYIVIQRSFMPDMKGHRLILIFITLIPALIVAIVQTLSLIKNPFAYLPPSQSHLFACLLVYIHFLLWALVVNIAPSSSKTNSIENVLIVKSFFWITIGIIAILFYILILGPGIGSFDGHPGLWR